MLGDGATAVEVDVRLDAPAGTPGEITVSAWVLGPDGDASRVPPATFAVASGGGTARAELPDGPGLRLLGFEAVLSGSQGAADVHRPFGDIDGRRLRGIRPPRGRPARSPSPPTEPSGRVPVSAAPAPVPVLVGAQLASRIHADAGDPLAFRVRTGGAEVDAVVAGIVPVVPGGRRRRRCSPTSARISRAAFDADAGVPAPAERWLATSEPESRRGGDRSRSHGRR